jgi:hypothetical protein
VIEVIRSIFPIEQNELKSQLIINGNNDEIYNSIEDVYNVINVIDNILIKLAKLVLLFLYSLFLISIYYLFSKICSLKGFFFNYEVISMELIYSSNRVKQVISNTIESLTRKQEKDQFIMDNLFQFIELQNEISMFSSRKINYIALYSNLLIKNKDMIEIKVRLFIFIYKVIVSNFFFSFVYLNRNV